MRSANTTVHYFPPSFACFIPAGKKASGSAGGEGRKIYGGSVVGKMLQHFPLQNAAAFWLLNANKRFAAAFFLEATYYE